MSSKRNKIVYVFNKNTVGGGWIRHGCWWMLITLAMVWLTGCGGAPAPVQPQPAAQPTPQTQPATEPTAQTSPAAQPAPQTQPAAQPTAHSPQLTPTGSAAGGNVQRTSVGAPGSFEPQLLQPQPRQKPVERSPRPEDLADWKQKDYLNAKRENDPRLLEAIHHLGIQHVGDASVVEILAAVLKKTEPDEQSANQTQPGSPGTPLGGGGALAGASAIGVDLGFEGPSQGNFQSNQHVITSAINALLLNDTDRSREVLREIVSGKLETDDDRMATPPAMKAMLEQHAPENEALMLQVLLKPEKFRKGSASSTAGVGGFGQLMPGGVGYGSGSPGQPLSAGDLRQQAMQWVDAMATESFRVKLVEYLLGDEATVTQREQLVPLLGKPRPENVAAQLLFYQASVPLAQLKADFEEYFTQLSSVALGHVLGNLADKEPDPQSPGAQPPKESRGGWGRVGARQPGMGPGGRTPQPSGPSLQGISSGAGVSIGPGSGVVGGLIGPSDLMGEFGFEASPPELDDPNVIYPVAKKLWAATIADTVIKRSQEIASLEQSSPALALAHTMPVDRVRAGLFAFLLSRHEDGPGRILGGAGSGTGQLLLGNPMGEDFGLGGPAGMPGGTNLAKTFWDPGFLIVVKSLPRDDKSRRSTKPKRGSRAALQPSGGGALGATGGGAFGEAEGGTADTEPATPAEQWLETSANLLLLLCRQCQHAARNQPEGSKSSGKIPVKPHRGANVTARYDVKLPEDAAEKLGDFKLDPIELHYIRMKDTAQFSRLIKHYRRVTRTKHRTFGQNGAWFDSLKDGETPGSKRSCDVLITRSGGGPGFLGAPTTAMRGRQKEPSEAMVIEILTIEMKDPTGGKEASETKSDK